jgi:hypothetical protein
MYVSACADYIIICLAHCPQFIVVDNIGSMQSCCLPDVDGVLSLIVFVGASIETYLPSQCWLFYLLLGTFETVAFSFSGNTRLVVWSLCPFRCAVASMLGGSCYSTPSFPWRIIGSLHIPRRVPLYSDQCTYRCRMAEESHNWLCTYHRY